jgi:hypothetical protein
LEQASLRDAEQQEANDNNNNSDVDAQRADIDKVKRKCHIIH